MNLLGIEVNYLSLLRAAVVSIAVGIAWYSPLLFGKQWMQLRGYTAEHYKKAQKDMASMYALSFVLALLTSYALWVVMALSENFYHYPRLQTGLLTGFLLWLGFMMPVQVTGEIFGARKWQLFKPRHDLRYTRVHLS
jgi:Protein of unknown function (DUF1761)